MTITFSADSLEDIAKMFDGMAEDARMRILHDRKGAKGHALVSQTWQSAVALWRKTPPGDAGDYGCSQMSTVAERYGDEMADAICTAMALEATAPVEERRAA